MRRYKTKTRPGLDALYDIRPGNGAGPFLQPRSPHGACERKTMDFQFLLERQGLLSFHLTHVKKLAKH